MKLKLKSKIVVWIDVDEVLVNFRKFFHQHLKERHSISVPDGFLPADWYYSDFFCREKFIEVMEGLPKNWASDLEILPGAVKFIKELRKHNCHIILITHLPADLAPERIKNLLSHGVYFDEIYFTFGRKKSEYVIALMERYEYNREKLSHFLIDDRAQNGYEIMKDCPSFDYFVTLNDSYNKEAIANLKIEFDKTRFNFDSKTNVQMYSRIIAKIKETLKKK